MDASRPNAIFFGKRATGSNLSLQDLVFFPYLSSIYLFGLRSNGSIGEKNYRALSTWNFEAI